MTVKGIGEAAVILPVAEIPIRYQGWEGKWRSGVAAQLPAAILIGIDLTEHVKRVLVQTHSQKENEGMAEEKEKVPIEIMRDTNDLAELIQVKNPQDNTFPQEKQIPRCNIALKKLLKNH